MQSVFGRIVLMLSVFVPVVTGCATTINESAPTTVANNSSQASVATIDPQLNRDELLAQMLQTVDALSNAMQKSDRQLATKHFDQIVLISDAVRPKIVGLSDQLAADFDRVVALAKSSVERNRPADADKALRFLPLIIDSLKNF